MELAEKDSLKVCLEPSTALIGSKGAHTDRPKGCFSLVKPWVSLAELLSQQCPAGCITRGRIIYSASTLQLWTCYLEIIHL